MLHDLYGSTLTLHFPDIGSTEYQFKDMILDISSNKIFKAVRVGERTETRNYSFFSSPEPKARVSYCHSAPSVVRPSVRKLFTFSTSSPEPLDEF